MAAHLTIMQHNVLAWTHERRNELYNAYRLTDPDVIMINSHGRRNNEKIKIFNYTVYQKNQYNENHDGVAIAVKKNIKHTLIDDFDENYLAIVITTSLGDICLATGYQPPRRPRIPINNILRIMRRNIPAYILGDLNARHRVLGHRNNNAAGKQIQDLLSQGTVRHLGPDFQTYIVGNRAGTPDIILSNANHIHNIRVTPGKITTSDHLPIIMRMAASPIQIPTKPRYNLRRANWDAFKTELTNTEAPELDHMPAANIEPAILGWFSSIKSAMDNHIPKTSYVTLPHPRVTEEIRNIQNQYLTLQQAVGNNTWTPQQRRQLRELQTQLQEICKRERKQHWDAMLTEIEGDYRDPAKFWRGVKKLQGNDQPQTPYIINDRGEKIFDEKDKEKEFRKYWAEIYKISDEENADFCPETERMVQDYLREHEEELRPYETIDLSRLQEGNPLTRKITNLEVRQVMKKFRKKKAPGHSQINKEIMQQLPDNVIENYIKILNASLSVGLFPRKFKKALLKLIPKAEKTTTIVQNHRPISLLETAAKIYERIINDRFRNYLQSNNINNPRQHSYRQSRGTHTALALLYEEIAVCQGNRDQCNIVFRDVSKAFDKVYHDGLKYKITRLELPRNFTALLCNFLDDRKARIQIGNYVGEEFTLYSGVPQGSCLSPTLFNLYVADLGELQNGNYTQYADDITQVIKYHGASKEMLKRKTERAIQEVNNFETKWKIKTNANKFKILHISKLNPRPIEINGTIIPYTRSAKALGMKISRTGIQGHIQERHNLAKIALAKLKRFSHMTPKTKLHLYKALVAPHLFYPPVPLNSISQTNKQKLQAIQNRALRWVNGDTPPYHTTCEDLHEKYNIKPVNVKCFEASYKIWGKLRDLQEEEVNRILAENTGEHHSWWPKAYVPDDATMPAPIFRRPENRNQDNSEEEEPE